MTEPSSIKPRELAFIGAGALALIAVLTGRKITDCLGVVNELVSETTDSEAQSENRQFEQRSSRVLQTIRVAGDQGLTLTQLCRQTRWLSSRERNELLAALRETGDVTTETDLGTSKQVTRVKAVVVPD